MTKVILLIVLVLGMMEATGCALASANSGLDGTVWQSAEKHGIAFSITFTSLDTNNDNKVESGEYACDIETQRNLSKVEYSPRAYLDAANALGPSWHCIIKRGKFTKFQPAPEQAFMWGDPHAKAAFQGNALVISVKGQDFIFTQEGAAPDQLALANFKRGGKLDGTVWESVNGWRFQYALTGTDLDGDGRINEEYTVEVTPLYSVQEMEHQLRAIKYPADDPWHALDMTEEQKAECERLKEGIELAKSMTSVTMTLLLQGNTVIVKAEHPRSPKKAIMRGTFEGQRLVIPELETLQLTRSR